MNCNYHQDSRIELICVASHKCQRKLCSQCEHQEKQNIHEARLLEQFLQSLLIKLKGQKLEEKNDFKQELSKFESMMKKVKEELSILKEMICICIDNTNEYYLDIINGNTNLAEQSQVKLEQLVEIHQGTSLDDWDCEKQFYLTHLKDVIKSSQQGINNISERLNQEIISISKFQEIRQKSFVWKEDLYEVLALTKDIEYINVGIFSVIIENLTKQSKTLLDYSFINSIINDYKENFFSKYYLPEIDQQIKFKKTKNDIQIIAHVIKNIHELEFYKRNYSLEEFKETRKKLIQQIGNDEKIIKFLIFLVQLTAVDQKFIQCGSNSLHLLVEMKADLRGKCFNNIRIQDTLLIGANFARCNLSKSELVNVNISGMNLNQAQLIDCKWRNLKIHQLNKLYGHKSSIQSVCFSPDGKTLASASYDKSILLWDVKTGQQIAKLNGHSNPVRSVCFSPNGATLASCSGCPLFKCEKDSDDNSIRLWDVKTGQQKAKLNGHCNCVYQVCFSPNSNSYILASCSDDRTIRLWNIQIEEQIAKLEGHFSGVQSVSFSPDGSKLASGSNDKSIRLWDVRTGQQKARFDGHSNTVQQVCFSIDGNTLSSCSDDQSICLWDVKTGQQKAKFDGHINRILSVCFSPDGTTLASGSNDNSIRLWNIQTRQQTAKLEASSIQSVCFSPDGSILASGSYDNSISLWDVREAQQKATLDGHRNIVKQVCFSPDGNILSSCSDDKSICLWDVKTGQQKAYNHTSKVYSICFSPDGTKLAFGSEDMSIRLWDVKTGQQKAKFDGHSNGILSVCFSPDGSILASGSQDYSIRLWDVKTGQQKAKLDGHDNQVSSVCFSPDGTTLASGSYDKSLCLWDARTGQQKAKLDGHSSQVLSVCFSPDGTTLASSNGCSKSSFELDPDDYSIRLWDIKTVQQKLKLNGHSGRVQAVCFSPDGTILASGSYDNSIRLWNVKNGQQKAKLNGHIDGVCSVCFSLDGTTLASGSADQSIRLWDISRGKQFQEFFERYENILGQFKSQFQKSLSLKDDIDNVATVRISQNPNLEANAALIQRGEFVNYSGVDLRQLFISKGSFILESRENCIVQ